MYKSKKMISNLLYKLYWRLTVNTWQVGFPQATTLENIVAGRPYEIKLLKGVPNDRWYADPFILDVSPTHITLLVEEFQLSCMKGRIARLYISRTDYKIDRNDTLLDLDTHLSFPTIVRTDDGVYILPENLAGGKWRAYKYDEASAKCILPCTVCEEPLVDAVMQEIDGEKYIFATLKDNANGKHLRIYRQDRQGTFKVCQTVTFADNTARNGGAFFHIDGRMYRPAQDCNGGYGMGLSIQRVERDADGQFVFTETKRLRSPRKHLDQGLHTLNEYKGVTVVDVSSYRHPLIGSVVDRIWHWLGWPTQLKK